MKNSKFFKLLFFLFSISIFILFVYQEKVCAVSKSAKQNRLKIWTEKFKKRETEEKKKKAEEEIKEEIEKAKIEEEKKKKLEELKTEMTKKREEAIEKVSPEKEVEKYREEARLKIEERTRQKIIEEEAQRKIREIKSKIYNKYGIKIDIPHKTPEAKLTEEFEAQRAWNALQYSGAAVDMKKYDQLNLKSLQLEEDLKLAEMKVNSFAPGSKERVDAEKEFEKTKKELEDVEIEKKKLWNDKIFVKLLKASEDASEFIKQGAEWLKQLGEDEKINYRWKQLGIIYKKSDSEVAKISKELEDTQKKIDKVNKEINEVLNKDGTPVKGAEVFVNQLKWQKRALEMKLVGASAGWTGSGGDIKKIYDTGKEIERFTKRLESLETSLANKKTDEEKKKVEESIKEVQKGLEDAKEINKNLIDDLNSKLKISKGITDATEVVINGLRKNRLLEELGKLKEDDDKIENIKEEIKNIDKNFPGASEKLKEYKEKQITAGKTEKEIDEELKKKEQNLNEVEELVGAMLHDIEEDKKKLKEHKTLLSVMGASMGSSVLQGILGDISGYDVEIPDAEIEEVDVGRFAGDFEGGVSDEYELSEDELSEEEKEKLARLRLARMAHAK